MKIHFPNSSQTIDVPAGKTVADACALAGHPLDLVCGGKGTCGKCKVIVKTAAGLTMQVLACQTPVSEGLTVLLSDSQTGDEQILTEAIAADPIRFDPPVTGYPVAFGALNLHDDRAFLATLSSVLPVDVRCDDPTLLYNIMTGIRRLPLDIINVLVEKPLTPIEVSRNAAKEAANLIDATADKTPMPFLGVAFDIGTTTVAGYLYDLEAGTWLATASEANMQRTYGADVISRIEAAADGKEEQLQDAIITTLNALMQKLCSKAGAKTGDIIHAVCCGNTTMLCLFAGIDPAPLGHAPFDAPITGALRFTKDELALDVNDHAIIDLMPPLGSFVGSDTTALLTALPKATGNALVIDLGTNGEIALVRRLPYGRVHVTASSTACGPALEGGGITMGMRGVSGAIEKVAFAGDHFAVNLIGDAPAKGLCGSGIIDAVAALLDAGLIAEDGAFISDDALKNHPLGDMVVTKDKVKTFVLLISEENGGAGEIIITQKDIRAIQLAKSAICSAAELLINRAGIDAAAIDSLVLSGAFGNYISVASALKIGLLPTLPHAKAVTVGNGAGAGAVRALLSREDDRRARDLPDETTVINMADDADFNAAFMKNTALAPKAID